MVNSLIAQLIDRREKATPAQLHYIVEQIVRAPFTAARLEVDQPLWGGFWNFDVIAPGYTLPAAELALLRAIRLDGDWPEGTSLAQFLADLGRAVRDPRAGLWALRLAGQPWAVAAGQSSRAAGQSDARLVLRINRPDPRRVSRPDRIASF